MHDDSRSDYDMQSQLILALFNIMRNRPASRNARLLETHISWVLLAGRYAYKIKKSVDLGFLDFTSLAARKHYCHEEIRLNRRLAPQIYLDVVAIGGSAESPAVGEHPAIEYAVRMRRFAVSKQLDRLMLNSRILPQHIDALGATVARFHRSLPPSDAKSPYGTPDSIYQSAVQNFEQLQELLAEHDDIGRLAALRQNSDSEFAACRNLVMQRLKQGFVRECHGDLHLGNIVLIGENPVPFDGIEFNPALRWIDVISEVAFTMMDLLHHRRADLAWRFLNVWLEDTGDYAGMPLLRFYLAYRAMVRAKVSAIRAAQLGISTDEATLAKASCAAYLELASTVFKHKQPALVITHGLPGSGKTTFAQIALERFHAIRLRSDVERKRLFGLDSLADSKASAGRDLYSHEITRRTYARLRELARIQLQAGYKVIVDAAFLEREERAQFRRLAQELSVPFAIADMQAGDKILRQRIMQRQRAANDASEADITVLEKLQLVHSPLTAGEKDYAAEFVHERASIAEDAAGWQRLERLLEPESSTIGGG